MPVERGVGLPACTGERSSPVMFMRVAPVRRTRESADPAALFSHLMEARVPLTPGCRSVGLPACLDGPDGPPKVMKTAVRHRNAGLRPALPLARHRPSFQSLAGSYQPYTSERSSPVILMTGSSKREQLAQPAREDTEAADAS
jgi:hypothetical protein